MTDLNQLRSKYKETPRGHEFAYAAAELAVISLLEDLLEEKQRDEARDQDCASAAHSEEVVQQ